MKSQQIYSIRDTKGEMYYPPMFMKTSAEAERHFASIANEDPKNLPGWYANVARFPEDHDLYLLGTFDDASGLIEALPAPIHIQRAINVKRSPSQSVLKGLDQSSPQ